MRRSGCAVLVVAAFACLLASVASLPSDRPVLTGGTVPVDAAGLLDPAARWSGPSVTFRVRGDVAPVMAGWWRDATRWAAGVTGLDLVEVADGPADITVIALPAHNGGWTRWPPLRDHVLRSVTVELGCCREEVAWHELVHALGAGGHSVGGLMDAARAGGLPPGPEVVAALRTLYPS